MRGTWSGTGGLGMVRKLGVPMGRAGMRSDADWHVCQRMRDRRAGLGLTQKQMAELIGVTYHQVQ